MSKFFLLRESVLLYSEKNRTSVEASGYFVVLSERKTRVVQDYFDEL